QGKGAPLSFFSKSGKRDRSPPNCGDKEVARKSGSRGEEGGGTRGGSRRKKTTYRWSPAWLTRVISWKGRWGTGRRWVEIWELIIVKWVPRGPFLLLHLMRDDAVYTRLDDHARTIALLTRGRSCRGSGASGDARGQRMIEKPETRDADAAEPDGPALRRSRLVTAPSWVTRLALRAV
ncbi:hypothetical protein GW17_00053710, partial [Ensete ventricosum]